MISYLRCLIVFTAKVTLALHSDIWTYTLVAIECKMGIQGYELVFSTWAVFFLSISPESIRMRSVFLYRFRG